MRFSWDVLQNMLENGHSNLQINLWVHITLNIFKISNSKNTGSHQPPPDLPTLKAYPTPGVGGRFGICSLKWRERMNLKVPGAMFPFGCAILSTRAKTVRGVGTTPLRRTRVKSPSYAVNKTIKGVLYLQFYILFPPKLFSFKVISTLQIVKKSKPSFLLLSLRRTVHTWCVCISISFSSLRFVFVFVLFAYLFLFVFVCSFVFVLFCLFVCSFVLFCFVSFCFLFFFCFCFVFLFNLYIYIYILNMW